MTEYIRFKDPSKCYGCNACVQICPRAAILMEPNDEGFLYPIIDASKCINCGLCAKICPAENISSTNIPMKVYAAQDKNLPALLDSSSGGLFSTFAERIISDNGYVVGCIFNEELKAVHILTNRKELVEKMRGSKYVQSDIRGIYNQIKTCLLAGNRVLFTGTPCQVDGLKRFLCKDYETLITVDLICHGVPSPLLLSDYLKSVSERKGKVIDIRFRDKKRNGWCSQGSISYNNRVKTISPYNSSYYYYYLQNSVSRVCCYSCKYSSIKRVSDITIGDYWNIETVIPKINSKNGYSVCLINTIRGNKFFDGVKDKLYYYETTLEDAVKGNGNLSSPCHMPETRRYIYYRIKKEGWAQVEKTEFKPKKFLPFIQKCVPKSIKRGIKKILFGDGQC